MREQCGPGSDLLPENSPTFLPSFWHISCRVLSHDCCPIHSRRDDRSEPDNRGPAVGLSAGIGPARNCSAGGAGIGPSSGAAGVRRHAAGAMAFHAGVGRCKHGARPGFALSSGSRRIYAGTERAGSQSTARLQRSSRPSSSDKEQRGGRCAARPGGPRRQQACKAGQAAGPRA